MLLSEAASGGEDDDAAADWSERRLAGHGSRADLLRARCTARLSIVSPVECCRERGSEKGKHRVIEFCSPIQPLL